MKQYCEMNESRFKFHFDSLLDGSEGIFPSGKKKTLLKWCILGAFYGINLMNIFTTENWYEKHVSHYI